ncbi:hypothetical protein DK867_09435 [Ochrobactrum sp. POC9]|uniref:helix-turn-helix domain-containing protein n=1 Tax=Ochrobactrum sp. A-1 TaxID=2920940 RepID=UPI000D707348|nr:hypothetical protein DK867_09435 [Ochrobactrum sp. POC9]
MECLDRRCCRDADRGRCALYIPPGREMGQRGTRPLNRAGQPPLGHMTTWRMILAQRMLGAGKRGAAVAEAVGYHSHSAFAQAFKRTLGPTPPSMK